MRNAKGQFVNGHKSLPGSEKGWIQPGHPLYSQWKGKKFSEKHRLNISLSHVGQLAWNKGMFSGKTIVDKLIRNSLKNQEWRKKCFERDNYTCQECGQVGGVLNVNHKILLSFIVKFHKIKTLEDAMKIKELWDIDNGETLCEKCHRTCRLYKMQCPDSLKLNLVS